MEGAIDLVYQNIEMEYGSDSGMPSSRTLLPR
jgi:hypothetical protein